ncbi:MAG: hypothetical protein HN350_08905 [Phycisphaerales bacterium]|jgi:hypothetical protein|nr:hypothetical protein [Phycisphaerales bacterium]
MSEGFTTPDFSSPNDAMLGNGGTYETPRYKRLGTGRNDPCPCGSGKKYKHCCITKNRLSRGGKKVLLLLAILAIGFIILAIVGRMEP